MTSWERTWQRIVALTYIECRIFLLRARIAVLPGFILLVGNLLTNRPARGLFMLSMTIAAVGGMAGPMVVVSDRKTGVLEFLANLPLSRRELALGRILPGALSAVVGTWPAVVVLWFSLQISGKTVPTAVLVPVGCVGAMLLFWLPALVTPLFARLPALVAVALPAAAVMLLSPLLAGTPIATDFWDQIGRILNHGVSDKEMITILLGSWIVMALLGMLVVTFTGLAVQRRGRPSQEATAVLAGYRDRRMGRSHAQDILGGL